MKRLVVKNRAGQRAFAWVVMDKVKINPTPIDDEEKQGKNPGRPPDIKFLKAHRPLSAAALDEKSRD